MANAGDIAVVALYIISLIIFWSIGLYTIFKNYKNIKLDDSLREIYLEKPVQTVLLNVGMILFILYHIIVILQSINLI